MKNNILTYAYKGFLSFIYLIIGKKAKIKDLYIEKKETVIMEEDSTAFVTKEQKLAEESKKLPNVGKLQFRYKAKNSKGKIINSTFDAYNIDQAKKFLIQEGLQIIKITPCGKYDIDLNFGKVLTTGELCFSLTQLATYLKAGITLIDSVRILAKQTEKARKRKVYELLIYDLLAGDSLSDSLEKQPKVFPKLLINMVKAAELTGDLTATLDEMAEYYTSIDKTKKEIKSAMTYPTVVFVFSIFVVAFILIWVVPQYAGLFASQGAELPKITQITMALSNFLKQYAILVVLAIVIILFTYIYLYKNVHSFRRMMQTVYLHIPVLKNIIMYSEISMFSRTFASLLNHGVHITNSMDVLLKITDNEIYRDIIVNTVKNLNTGGKISETFKDHWAIPIVTYEMIVTGENTGQLGLMMEKVANYYDNLHKNSISQIKSLMEPILIVFLAGSVGIIILSVILPMFQMYQVLS